MGLVDKLPLLFPGINLRPALACELSPLGALAARQDAETGLLTQFAPLSEHALVPGLKAGNIVESAPVIRAVRAAVQAVAERGRTLPGGRALPANRALTLIVPDAAARVLLLDFDSLPSKQADALQILRFRLRKLIPFDADTAAISWQLMTPGPEGVRVLLITMPREVVIEYERVVREAGFLPGVVLPSTIAAMPLAGIEPALVVNRNGGTLTTAILRGQDLLLHRALDFVGSDELGFSDSMPRLPRSAEAQVRYEEDEVRRSVGVAIAYYEDTVGRAPEEVFYIGPGTAEAFAALLGEPGVRVRDLGAAPGLPSRTVPRSLLAPVTGALLNA